MLWAVHLPLKALHIGSLSAHDRLTVRKLAKEGALVLVETGPDEAPAVLVTARVASSAFNVRNALMDVSGYPAWMPAHDRVQPYITTMVASGPSYQWSWTLTAFTLRGHNFVHDYTQAPSRHYVRPVRVELRYASGQLGSGRFIWRIDPISTTSCWVTIYAKLDLRKGDSVAKALTQTARSFNRSTEIGLALYMLQGVRDRLGVAHLHTVEPLQSMPELNQQMVRPLLDLGDILWVGLSAQKMQEVWAMGRTGMPYDKLKEILSEPKTFGRAMMRSTLANAEMLDSEETLLKWGLSIPLLGSSGLLRLDKKPDAESEIEVRAIEGAMKGGVWTFSSWQLPWGEGCLLGWAKFDAGDGFWLTRHLVEREPKWSSGLAVASEILSIRAIRAYLSR